MMKKLFKSTVFFYVCLTLILAGINYFFRTDLNESILVGLSSALCVFYAPVIMQKEDHKK